MKMTLSALAAVLLIAGCAHSNHNKQTGVGDTHFDHNQTVQRDGAPSPVVQPVEYSGRAWFDTNKATLRPEAQAELSALAAKVMQAKQNGALPNGTLVGLIVGHTDSRASVRYNQKLSERRAAAVTAFLASQGVPVNSIKVIGRSELQPVASNRTAKGRQLNRRVDIFLDGPGVRVVYD